MAQTTPITSRFVMALNNYLQGQGQLAALHWAEEHIGPAGRKEWKATCYIHNEVKGVGTSVQKGTAKELAAKQALANLGQTVG